MYFGGRLFFLIHFTPFLYGSHHHACNKITLQERIEKQNRHHGYDNLGGIEGQAGNGKTFPVPPSAVMDAIISVFSEDDRGLDIGLQRQPVHGIDVNFSVKVEFQWLTTANSPMVARGALDRGRNIFPAPPGGRPRPHKRIPPGIAE